MNGPEATPTVKPDNSGKATSPSSAYRSFTRQDWARLRAETPLTLELSDVKSLTGLLEPVSLAEVEEVYLPLTRLLNLHAVASQNLHRETNLFLQKSAPKPPFIIGIAGSVAVGKSTMARILCALLAKWDRHKKVALVPTDGFLWPNIELERRGLMQRKGFPESYNARALVRFLAAIKQGQSNVKAPVYSHFNYDIVAGQSVTVDRPDILIIEGLNVLQPPRQPDKSQHAKSPYTKSPHIKSRDTLEHLPYVSDFFNFSIYMDAHEKQLEHWYIERFMVLRETAFKDPGNYFHRYSKLHKQEAEQKARDLWRTINLVNLRDNIRDTRPRADLILRKGEGHAIDQVLLRKQ
ncbi:MAG: type I pantothenate kinase [Hyphomicrobiaceae bacterium]|nr:type I pantothenate kinase [Hyphomicrobiaceae bacterium]